MASSPSIAPNIYKDITNEHNMSRRTISHLYVIENQFAIPILTVFGVATAAVNYKKLQNTMFNNLY